MGRGELHYHPFDVLDAEVESDTALVLVLVMLPKKKFFLGGRREVCDWKHIHD
jgi:hypothetical protein